MTDARSRFVEAMKIVCKHTAGYQNAQKAAVHAFADAVCEGAGMSVCEHEACHKYTEVGGLDVWTNEQRDKEHESCRAALEREVFNDEK